MIPGMALRRWSGGEETWRVRCSQPIFVFCVSQQYGRLLLLPLLYSGLVHEYISTERCAPSAPLLVPRPEAACSLATERRAARQPRVGREATSLYSCVTIPTHRLIDRSAAVCCRG